MPAPANDLLANALVLNTGTQVTGDSSSATPDSGDIYSGSHSVWFRWTAATNSSVTFQTVGSAIDTVLYIFTAKSGVVEPVTAASDLNYFANNDDGPGIGLASSITFTPTPGRTYYISLSDTVGTGGNYVLNYPSQSVYPYVVGTPQGTSFTTSGTSVTYTGGGITGTNVFDVLCVNSDNTVTTPSGWTAQVTAVTNQGSYIFTKAENGVTSATIALGGGVSTNTDAIWVRVANTTGVDTGANGSAQTNASPGSTTPSFTSSALAASGELALAFAALHAFTGSAPTSASWSTGYVELANATIGSGTSATYGSVAAKVPAGTAAESPTFTWTNATSNRYTLFTAFSPTATSTSAPAEQSAVSVAAYDATVTAVGGAPAGQSAVAVTAYDATVSVGASGAVLALDASSPGTITANAQTVQTASFTPPAGAMLYAVSLMAASSPTANRTITITDTVGLTWTLQASSPLGPAPAPAGSVAVVYSAPVISSAAMRVTTSITSNGLNGILLKVFVYTGADQSNPIDQAVAGHSAGAVVSQAITTTVPGTIPYLGNIDAGGQAAPTTAAGTGTFTTAKPNVDQMWIARGSPMVVANPGTVTLASSAPTTSTVNDWVMFGVRSVLINQAPVSATAYDATVSTSSAVNAPAGQSAVTADGQAAQGALGVPAAQSAVTADAQAAQVANGSAAEQAAVTTSALDASAASGIATQDAAVAVAAYDASVSTSSSVSAAAEQTAVTTTGYDATVTVSGSTSAPADYAPVTTTALSPYVDASTLAEMAAVTAAAYLATVAVAINPAAEVAQVTTAAYDATTALAAQPAAETTTVTAAAYDATTATTTSTNAPAGQAAVTVAAFAAVGALAANAETAFVGVAAQQPPPPGVTSSPNRVLTTTSRENSITTISDGRYRTITTQ